MAAILRKVQELKETDTNMGSLSVLQAQQTDGMTYCAVKKVMLNKVVKLGNTITYDTELAQNAKHQKKAQLVFVFIDGVSEEVGTNDFFTNICHYIKE